DGRMTLEVIDENAILVVSYIGYETQEVAVSGQTNLNIVLVSDSELLEEVVVTALGIQRKTRDLGYSVEQLTGSNIQEAKEVNYLNALQATMAGLQIGGNSGSMRSEEHTSELQSREN